MGQFFFCLTQSHFYLDQLKLTIFDMLLSLDVCWKYNVS